ncbi:MAG: HAD hydrolase-like protein [Acidimicrobiia bacterium]|nr:HAD hydrolase-like protein [Acidimicrobiia bacterium]
MTTARQCLIFFDLDGCIVDSTIPIRTCLDAAFAENALPPIPPDGLNRHVGPPLQVTLAEVVAENGREPELVEVLIAAYRSRYVDMSVELAAAYPGVAELVVGLVERGARVGVVTSKPQRFAVPILEALGLDRHLEVIVGPDLTEDESKVATLARAIGLVAPLDQPASLMIGDRHHDIDAAIAHDMSGIGVLWGFGSRAELEGAGAVAVAETAADLALVLGAVVYEGRS